MKFLPAFSSEKSARFLYANNTPTNSVSEAIRYDAFADMRMMREEERKAVREEFNSASSELKKDMLEKMIKERGIETVLGMIRTDKEWALRTFTENLGGGKYRVNFYGNKFLEKHISLFDLLPDEKKYVQIMKTWGNFHIGGDIGVRMKVAANDKFIAGIGYQNLDDFGGARNTLKIGVDEDGKKTVFRIIDNEDEIKQILQKKGIEKDDIDKITPEERDEKSFDQKRTQLLTAVSFFEAVGNRADWITQVKMLPAEQQQKIKVLFQTMSAKINEKVSSTNRRELRKVLVEQLSVLSLELAKLQNEATSPKDQKLIMNLTGIATEELKEFLGNKRSFIVENNNKMETELRTLLSPIQKEELLGYIEKNKGNLDSKLVLGLVHKMGLEKNVEDQVLKKVFILVKNRDKLKFLDEVEEKNKITKMLSEIYFDSDFKAFLGLYSAELKERGIETSVDKIMTPGNVAKMQMFLKENYTGVERADEYIKIDGYLEKLAKVEIKNLELDSKIQKSETSFQRLQNVVDDLQKDPEKFWKEAEKAYEKRETNIGSIRSYIGSVAMTPEEKQQSDEMLADLPADVAVSENLGNGRFEVKIGNADAELILDFQKDTMSPKEMPEARKEYLEFPLEARYLPGLQTVAAMQNVMFPKKESFAKKMEDFDGPESLAKLFFVLFYPRNDVLTEAEENRWRTFGNNLHKNGETFFDFLAKFENPPIIDNGRIWLQAVPLQKAKILSEVERTA